MLRSIVRKEVREMLPLVLLALVVQLYLVYMDPLTGWFFAEGAIPFIGDVLTGLLFLIAGTVAAVLGLWQTTWESYRGTFQFLLHRPAPRSAIVGVKLLVGVTVCLLIAGLPIACYALWAATPGTHPSPFEWSMTTSAVLLVTQIPLVYLGAFLSGLRPGGWLGSRALPLAAGSFALIMLQTLFSWWLPTLLLGLLFEGSFVVAILEVAAARDYS